MTPSAAFSKRFSLMVDRPLGHLVSRMPGTIRKSAAQLRGGLRRCATDLQLDTRADYEPLTDTSVVYA
jgi:hypothetical protein